MVQVSAVTYSPYTSIAHDAWLMRIPIKILQTNEVVLFEDTKG
jgi:hypothetical protein